MTARIWFGPAVALLFAFALITLAGCNERQSQMAGCAVRIGGPPISDREIADCAAERAERNSR